MPDSPITSEPELRDIVGRAGGLAVAKSRPTLDRFSRAFIERSPFLCIATAAASGEADVSPRGDPPGFVQILDDTHILIPERPGNARADTMANILENPNVGLIFMVPGFEDTLRLNGRAWIERDPARLAAMAVDGKAPKLAIGVAVEEVFLHCAKAFRRSRLWDPASRQDRSELPGIASIIMEQAAARDAPVDQAEAAAADAAVERSYREQLY